MFNFRLILGVILFFSTLLQPPVWGDDDNPLVSDAEIAKVVSSLNNWDMVTRGLPWYEGKTVEVEAVRKGLTIQKAKFTVADHSIQRCHNCSPTVIVRVDSRRVPQIMRHMEERNIPRLVYDATKTWFRVIFIESPEMRSDTKARIHLQNTEVEAILEDINSWERLKPILKRNDGKVSRVSIVSEDRVYQSAKFTVTGERVRRCRFCIPDMDVMIDAADVEAIIDHIEKQDEEALYRDASRVWFRIGFKGMMKMAYRFYSL